MLIARRKIGNRKQNVYQKYPNTVQTIPVHGDRGTMYGHIPYRDECDRNCESEFTPGQDLPRKSGTHG